MYLPAELYKESPNPSKIESGCGNFCLFVWGCHEHRFGIGADAVPAGQWPGPILLPWADYSLGTSEPDLARTQSCNHRNRCQPVMELDCRCTGIIDCTIWLFVVNSLLGNPAALQRLFACCVSLQSLPACCDPMLVCCCICRLEDAYKYLSIRQRSPRSHQ